MWFKNTLSLSHEKTWEQIHKIKPINCTTPHSIFKYTFKSIN